MKGTATQSKERLAEVKKLLFHKGLADSVARRGTKSEQHLLLSLVVAMKVAHEIAIGPKQLASLRKIAKKYLQ